MTHQLDTEKLAREAGIDDSAQLTPYMLQRLSAFAALVLEEAAKRLEADTESAQDFEGAINAIRALAAGVRHG